VHQFQVHGIDAHGNTVEGATATVEVKDG